MELIDREKLKQDMFNYIADGYAESPSDCKSFFQIVNDQPTVNTWISVEDRLPTEEEAKDNIFLAIDYRGRYVDVMYFKPTYDYEVDEDTVEPRWFKKSMCSDYYNVEIGIRKWYSLPIPEYKESE